MQELPVIIVFKAMGIEADQEAVQMIGTEEKILAAVAPCLEESIKADVHTQKQVANGCLSSQCPSVPKT